MAWVRWLLALPVRWVRYGLADREDYHGQDLGHYWVRSDDWRDYLP